MVVCRLPGGGGKEHLGLLRVSTLSRPNHFTLSAPMADRRWKNIGEYLLFLALAFLVRSIPRRAALALGSGLGWSSQFLLGKRKRRALDNMQRAFPDMPRQEVQRNVKRMFRHLGISGVEMLLLDRFRTQADLERYFDFTGVENVREAFARGRGVLILTAHLGFWEVGTFFLPKLGFPTDFVAKRMKNPYVDRYFQRLREAGGGQCIDAKRGARRILRSLADNRGVAVLLDQHTSPRTAVPVDFFGRPAYTTPIITQLAMKYGVPVLPSFCYRTPDNRYRVEFGPMVLFENDASEAAVVRNTAYLTSLIEQAVRQDISQWFWVHRRWRS